MILFLMSSGVEYLMGKCVSRYMRQFDTCESKSLFWIHRWIRPPTESPPHNSKGPTWGCQEHFNATPEVLGGWHRIVMIRYKVVTIRDVSLDSGQCATLLIRSGEKSFDLNYLLD